MCLWSSKELVPELTLVIEPLLVKMQLTIWPMIQSQYLEILENAWMGFGSLRLSQSPSRDQLLLTGFNCFRTATCLVRAGDGDGCPGEAGLRRHGLQNVCNCRPNFHRRPRIRVQGLEDGLDRCHCHSFPLAAVLAFSAGICEVSTKP